MDLKRYDGKLIRLFNTDGKIYEGKCGYYNEEYCEFEYGVNKECLEIVNFIFFEDEIKSIEIVEGFSDSYGEIEIANLLDGIDSVKDELFCEEDIHISRMLNCLWDYIINTDEIDFENELDEALNDLLGFSLSEENKKLINRFLNRNKFK